MKPRTLAALPLLLTSSLLLAGQQPTAGQAESPEQARPSTGGERLPTGVELR